MKFSLITLNILISSLITISAQSEMQDTKIPYHANYTTESMTADGKLDESCWDTTEIREMKYHYDILGYEGYQKTQFRMLWDENNLYVAFECEDRSIFAKERARDQKPYRDDCAEIFLIPASVTAKTHIGFEVNVLKSSNDFVYLNEFVDEKNAIIKSYNPEFSVGVEIDGTLNDDQADKGWVMEMIIPLKLFGESKSFTPVKRGNKWTFLAIRQDRYDLEEKERSFSTLFPMQPDNTNVHNYKRFGTVLFVKE